MTEKELARTREEARRAREQMMGTVDEIKQRLSPRTLAEEVWEGVRDRSTQLADDAVELARARPGAAAAVAATAVMILARNPLLNAANSLFSRAPAEEEEADTNHITTADARFDGAGA